MELSLTLEQVIDFLLETDLFCDLDAGELGDIVQIMQLQRFRPEQAIFSEGDAGNAWFMIYGAARVEKRDPFTLTRQVAVLGPHACFGEMAILDDFAVRERDSDGRHHRVPIPRSHVSDAA